MKNPIILNLLKLKYKLQSEHLSDAIRTTLCIFAPIILFFYLGHQQTAIATGTGALLIAATDVPNTLKGKVQAALENLLLFGITTIIITSFVLNITLTTLFLSILAFAFAMLACYGNRYVLSGTMATALAIFIIGLKPNQPIDFTLGILAGATFYYVISIIHQLLKPFRSLEQAMAECLQAMANFLKTKADCYNPDEDLTEAQSENILQHIKVSEKQQLVRVLLLSEKQAAMQTSKKGKTLFNQCIILIDIYQQLSASHHNYKIIQQELAETDVLSSIRKLIYLQAAILANLNSNKILNVALKEQFRAQFKNLTTSHKNANQNQQQLLNAISKNLDDIFTLIENYFDQKHETTALPASNTADYSNFISMPNFNWQTLKEHLKINDPIFRFSLRLSLLLSATYLITETLKLSQYTYWILLTILVVARPKLALTWKRNKQRILGTIIGISASILLLLATNNTTLLLCTVAIFLTGFFLYSRLNYLKAVAFITPAILIALAIFHGNWPHLIGQRLLFTLIGCAIAIPTAYLFPIWETSRINGLLINTYTTALAYLKSVLENYQTNDANLAKIRLTRKDNYLATAELSEALQMIKIEPKSKSLAVKTLQNLQTAAYQISSIISSISIEKEQNNLSHYEHQLSIAILEQNLQLVNGINSVNKTINVLPAIEFNENQSAILNALLQIHQEIKIAVNAKD